MLGQGSLGAMSLGQPEEYPSGAVLAVATVVISQATVVTVVFEVPGVNVGFS